jgi:gamma-glutamylaminecyclotransferase
VKATKCRLFVYDTLLDGQPDHHLLAGAEALGAAHTEPIYQLVDLGSYAALVAEGSTSVAGELYLVDLALRARLDRHREVPILFERATIRLADGAVAEAYLMSPDRVRGRRRLRRGDWRQRFAPSVPRRDPPPFVRWARDRFSKS